MNKKTLFALGVTVFAAGTSFSGNLVGGERRSGDDTEVAGTPVAVGERSDSDDGAAVFSVVDEVVSELCSCPIFDLAGEFYTSGMSKTVEVLTLNEIISRSDLVDSYGKPVTRPADCLYQVLCKPSPDGHKKLLVVTRSEFESKFDQFWKLSAWLCEMHNSLQRAGTKVLVLNDTDDAWVVKLALAKSLTREAVEVGGEFGTLNSGVFDLFNYGALDVFYDARPVAAIRASAAAGEVFGGNAALFNR